MPKCTFCKKDVTDELQHPGPRVTLLLRHLKKSYKDGGLCRKCYDEAQELDNPCQEKKSGQVQEKSPNAPPEGAKDSLEELEVVVKVEQQPHGSKRSSETPQESLMAAPRPNNERELEVPEVVEVEEKNQEFVPMRGKKRMKLKKYLADVHLEREKVVTDETVNQPGFHHGPNHAKYAQFHLNYFFNSF
ncbi:uncharacterized protein LOC129786778 [Lutzomyia longipalpis]|nr:uncharacterized protein LOC129786778 [Lutzomyia longipalpis]